MANPSFRAAGAQVNGSATTTVSVPAPAGHLAGDLLVLVAGAWDTSTIATPSGWTLLGDSGAFGTSNRYRAYVFWKLAASSAEPNVSVVQAISGSPQAQMVAVKDVAQVTPVDATAGWATPSVSATVATPAITTVSDNALVVFVAIDTAGLLYTAPSGMALQFESGMHITKTAWADVTKTPAGTKAADSFTRSGTSGFGKVFGFAVAPATAAVGGASGRVPSVPKLADYGAGVGRRAVSSGAPVSVVAPFVS